MEKQNLKMFVRQDAGKSASKKLRKEGFVPAVLYGHGTKTAMTKLAVKDAGVVVKQKGMAVFYVIEDGDAELKGKRILVKEVVQNPISDSITHIDFYEIPDKTMIKVNVPIKIRGRETVVKNGGIVEWEKREVELKAFPEEVPNFVEIDVAALAIGHSLHLSDIKLPANVKLVEDGGIAVVSVVPPKQEVEMSAEEKAAKLEASLVDKNKDKEKEKPKEKGK